MVYTLHFYSVAVAMPGTLNRVSASLASYMAAWFLLQLHAWPDCETTAFLQKAFNCMICSIVATLLWGQESCRVGSCKDIDSDDPENDLDWSLDCIIFILIYIYLSPTSYS